MTTPLVEGDFLRVLLELNPIAVAIIIWAWGWGSLLLVALRSHAVKILLRHPAIMFGDFILLPVAGGLIAWFYSNIGDASEITSSSGWAISASLLAVALTVMSERRVGHFSAWYVPHLSFYWFMSYIVLMLAGKGLTQMIVDGGSVSNWTLWAVALGLVLTHISLPLVFGSKALPRP